MYADFTVPIPSQKGKITKKTIRGTTYVYYQLDRFYNPDLKYTVPKTTPIGKICSDKPDQMIPNDKYELFFPDAIIPKEKSNFVRSSCLKVGTYIVIKKLIKDYQIDVILDEIIGDDTGLFLDFISYSIITENNAGQYYPSYAYNHPLFTTDMRVYSDSKVLEFINSITAEQSAEFLNRWNDTRNTSDKIYISYDSTNKNCQAGDIYYSEFGHAKDNSDKPIINYAIAYGVQNREPLFYEMYPGSIVDVKEFEVMLDKAVSYGYKHAAFIIDRGYFSKSNIQFMDEHGYDFIIMLKGMKPLVRDLVLKHKGTFEEDRRYSIRDYQVSGITIKQQLFGSDDKERYLHIFYNGSKQIAEREELEQKLDQIKDYLKLHEGKVDYELPSSTERFFEAKYKTETDGKKIFVTSQEKINNINEEIKLCGYFVIVTSEEMSAAEAIEIYKSRDPSEKLFRGDKSYLGNNCFRVHSFESAKNKVFIEFVALAVRNKIYTCLKDQMKKNNRKDNYMTTNAAIRELEKIEMIKGADKNYRLDHALTKTQKEILKAFDMEEINIREEVLKINEQLKKSK